MVEYRRLPLEKLKNCRDLGGYAAGDGKITAYHRFFRSEIPRDLSSRDKDFLLRAGLTDVMDFRGADELERIPNDLRNLQGIKYHWCPMYSKQVAHTMLKEKEAKEFVFSGWDTHYIEMLEEYRDWTYESLSVAAQAEGALLFNCTTGKDRTGLFSMLLLSIAGVDKADIVADYSVSMVYMHEVYPTLNFPPELPREIFVTAPRYMRGVLEYMEKTYGGVTEYIRTCGVEEEKLERIRDKMLIGADLEI